MKKCNPIYVLTILAAMSLAFRVEEGYARSASPDAMASRWQQYITERGYRELVSDAKPVYDAAVAGQDHKTEIYAGAYLAQAYSALSQYDSVYYYLDRISAGIEASEEGLLKVILYNTKAIMSLSVEQDYASALDYLNKALDEAERGGYDFKVRSVLYNIANLYERRNDTSGLEYAGKAYWLSREAGDMYVLPSAIITMSQMMYMKGDYDNALRYNEELGEIADSTGNVQYKQMYLLINANIYESAGDTLKAQSTYRDALALSDSVADKAVVVSAHISYGNFLLSLQRPAEALDVFDAGLDIATRNKQPSLLGMLFQGLSEAYAATGDKDKGYEYYRQYDIMEQQRKDNERKFTSLIMRNETLRYDKELADKEIKLMRARNRVIFITGIVIILLSCVIFLSVLYRRKNKTYLLLAESHYKLSQAMEKASENKAAVSRGSDDGLYLKIEKLMKEDKLYRSQDISLETIAGMLNTNRSYISKEINTASGMTFYNYINGYRIAEAESILQDQYNDTPLKVLCGQLGFNSMSVFYRSFQKATGIPPSRYREEMRRIRSRETEK